MKKQVENSKTEKIEINNNEKGKKSNKKVISPYQKYLLDKNAQYLKYKQKYFDFYDDIKDKTHQIYDW